MKPGIGVDTREFQRVMDKLSLSPKDMSNILDAGNNVIEGHARINHEPNVDTGFLMSTIQAQKPVVESPIKGYAEVWVGAEYAAHLEYGTSRMNAYPFLRPACYDNESEINSTMAHVLMMQQKGIL